MRLVYGFKYMEFEEILAILVMILEDEYEGMSRSELIQKNAEAYLRQFDWNDEAKAKQFLKVLMDYKQKKAPQLEGVLTEGQTSPKVEAVDEDFVSVTNFKELDELINEAIIDIKGLNPLIIAYISTFIETCKKRLFDEEVPEIMITPECTALFWKGPTSDLSLVATDEGVEVSITYEDSEKQDSTVYPLDSDYDNDIITNVQVVTCGGFQ